MIIMIYHININMLIYVNMVIKKIKQLLVTKSPIGHAGCANVRHVAPNLMSASTADPHGAEAEDVAGALRNGLRLGMARRKWRRKGNKWWVLLGLP